MREVTERSAGAAPGAALGVKGVMRVRPAASEGSPVDGCSGRDGASARALPENYFRVRDEQGADRIGRRTRTLD